ncbi:MAG: site-specific DNA-methyltransferase [Endomicrobia bacterium]|nr:site-specific DNA-methyltransferase [Endomicrobiia bacterium]
MEYLKLNNFIFPRDNLVYHNLKFGILLYRIDCIKFMDELVSKYPNGVFDTIFADPPYFLSNGGITCYSGKIAKVDKGSWDKSMGVNKNHEFNLEWLSRCQKLLKPNGTIWVSGTHHIIYSIGFAMQQLGMKILNNITWEKTNPPPNISCRYFTHSTETIIWAAKNVTSKHLFNYQKIREISNGKQMKSVWRIPAPEKEEKIFGKHPTQKPLKLLEIILLASTKEKDLIFDPFAGSSTTAVAAIKLNRLFVGCELEKEYIDLSIKRIENEISNKKQTLFVLKKVAMEGTKL